MYATISPYCTYMGVAKQYCIPAGWPAERAAGAVHSSTVLGCIGKACWQLALTEWEGGAACAARTHSFVPLRPLETIQYTPE